MSHIAIRTSATGRLRLLAGLTLTTATIGLLGLLPTVQAQASTPAVTLPPTAEVESVLGQTPLGSLPTGQLAEQLSQLEGLEGINPTTLQEALTKVLDELVGKGATLEEVLGGNEAASLLKEKLEEVLGPLASHLAELLGGNPQAKLTEALESTGAGEVIGKLLGGSPEPQALIEQILQALGPERLQSLLGSVLSGEPFSKSTEEELAQKLGATPEGLAAELGKTAEQLPATAMALTAPLADGETLGVLNGLGGATLAVVKGAGENVGVTGGTGGPGGSGSGNSTTTPGATVTVTAPPAPSAGVAGVKAGKLRVISHKVKGATATVVVEVPSAGKLAAGGKGVRSISRETAKSERVTIHPSLTKAGTSAVRKHHRKLKVPVKVSFKQTGGPASSVVVPLIYR